MAVWGAKKNRRDCKKCKQLQKAGSFEKGSKVKIAGLGDCENCEVMKNSPSERNENIVALYNALPREGGVTVTDFHALFEIYEIPQELRFDYYQRLLFLHNTIMGAREKEFKKSAQEKKGVDQWKKKRFSAGGRRSLRRTH